MSTGGPPRTKSKGAPGSVAKLLKTQFDELSTSLSSKIAVASSKKKFVLKGCATLSQAASAALLVASGAHHSGEEDGRRGREENRGRGREDEGEGRRQGGLGSEQGGIVSEKGGCGEEKEGNTHTRTRTPTQAQ